jgi:hypothetical protein
MPEQVRDIYELVNSTNIQASTRIEQARQYYETRIPGAEAEANALIAEAQANYANWTAAANSDLYEFYGVLEEYNANPEVVNDPKMIKQFGDIILKYDSCLGTEVFNEKNGTTGYDRILWDNLLMYTLPYGKNVIGFSNTDAHTKSMVNSSFSVFMMEENNVENIKETMQNGNFFMVTRNLRKNVVTDNNIGPDEAFDVIDEIGLAYPMFTEVSVDGHKITVSAKDADKLQFIANGKVIAKYDIGEDAITLDLDTIEGAEDFLYVRAEILGEGGMTITQALTIDNGSEPLEFVEKTGVEALWEDILQILSSLRLVVIVQEIIRAF